MFLMRGRLPPIAWIENANVVCEGDSLTTAFGDATISWVDALNQYAPFSDTGATASGTAASGDTITDMASNPPDSQIVAGERNVLVFMGGTNDIRGDHDTPAEAKAELDAYVADRKAAGWDRVVVLSPTPADEVSEFITASEATAIDNYIQLIRDNPPPDADAVGHATDATELIDPLDTTYFLDGLHYTDAGHTVLAEDIVWPVLEALV